MKKLLTRTGILIALLLPSVAFGAYNDVTLTTDTVISVNGVTMNVSGSSATMETLTVNATNFSVNVLSGSTLTVNAASQKVMSVSTEPVVTVTPSSSTCPLTTSSTSSGGGGSPSLIGSSGGGGGGGGGSATPASTPATTPISTPMTPVSGLTITQVEAILSLLSSFDADAATLASVRSVLYGQASTGTGTAVSTFVRNLELGMSGADVKALQVYLNTHGYAVSSSGPGSPGNETSKFGGATRAAVIKFQKAMGITPAVGYFGPKTRAAAK